MYLTLKLNKACNTNSAGYRVCNKNVYCISITCTVENKTQCTQFIYH
jgi:hypothetical protein